MRPFALLLPVFAVMPSLLAQEPPGGPPGMPGPGGGGPGGPPNETIACRDQFDADKNGRLDRAERQAARAWLKENRPQRGRRGPGGFGPGPGGQRENAGNTPASEGRRLAPADVANHAAAEPFDPDIVRTIFIEFADDDWFAELTEFYRTDVEVPATVTIDGKAYRNVGVGFRGNTSFMMAPGRKKSLDLAFDHADSKQRWQGQKNLDLLNAHTDPSMVRELLHGVLANRFMPAPRTALTRVAINGEDHGVYVAVQQFDKAFAEDHFGTDEGDRFKVPPDFRGNGGLRFLGEDVEAYKKSYQLKSKEREFTWQSLVDLCTVLERTETADLPRILPQHLDVDGALWFLAIDNALGDDDGYHSRASDYLLYRDPSGRFHPLARDNNEILLGRRTGMRPPGMPGDGPPAGAPPPMPPGQRDPFGPGAGGPPGGPPGGMAGPGGRRGGPGSAATSPLQMAERQDRPLLRRLLEIPEWKARYLGNLRALADALDDSKLAPQLANWQRLLDPLAKNDAHSLYGYDAFLKAFAVDDAGAPTADSLRGIVQKRRQAILDDAAMQGRWPSVSDVAATIEPDAAGPTLRVTCKASRGDVVRLFVDRGRFGSFIAMLMVDDGAHGDGKAGDGVFGANASTNEGDGDVRWRWYVEARAADSGHVVTAPAGNGALPFQTTAKRATIR